MSRKIVFINQATGYLTIDVINEFVRKFDHVALITGSIRLQDKELDPSIGISKIVKYNRGGALRKATSWIIGTVQIFVLLTFRYRDYEKFFYTIPPTAYLLTLNFKAPYSVTIFDLYPEALKAFGYDENRLLYRLWEKRNRKVFSRAHRIFTLSDKMRSKVLEYSNNADIREISNWSAFSGFVPVAKERNGIRKREGMEGKFIVQYSGNIGVTHKVEILVELAQISKEKKEIEFIIIGRGERSKVLAELINSKGLTNCRLLPYRKDEELYESLCAADLAVVTLDDLTPDVSVPSKVYNILAAGVPIMAIARTESSIANIILKHGAGRVFEKDNFKGMSEFINELINNPKFYKILSGNSLKAAENYTNANAADYLKAYLN